MTARVPRFSDRAEDAALAIVLAAAGLLGTRLAPRIGARVGRLGFRPLGIRRAQVEANLRTAFPGRDPAWIRRTAAECYAHLGREAVYTLLAARHPGTVQGEVRHQGLDALERGLAAGHGVVLTGGHFGNWELGVGSLAEAGFPISAVVRRQRNPLFDRRIREIRLGFGIDLIDRGSAPRRALRALRANRIVVFIADQDARRAGVFVPFFGRLASTPRGPAVLAQRTGASLAFIAPVRGEGDRLDVRVEPLEVDRGGEPEDVVRRITAAYVASLEAAVRAAPQQYLWHHRRWKTRAPVRIDAEPVPEARP